MLKKKGSYGRNSSVFTAFCNITDIPNESREKLREKVLEGSRSQILK